MLLRLVPENTDVKFLGMRKIALTISVFLVLASVALFAVNSLNYGIDFRGGVNLLMKSDNATADISKIRTVLADVVDGGIAVKEFGSPKDVEIGIRAQDNAEADNEALKAILATLETEMPDLKFQSSEGIGPEVSGELKEKGAIAITVAVFAVLLYIWVRFEWQFGVGAVIALVHDVTLTIGFFSITGLEFNLSIIAALLTIVGYSLNDTVVVYDRVRENVRKFRKKSMEDVLDLSLNQTLSRTVMTSVTTLLALVALFVWGGPSISGFTAAMIWGVVVGTYSSVFIASPMLLTFKLDRAMMINEDDKNDPTVDKSKLTPFDHV
ncbi:MAG: protein translocase subunit SecF [Kordiimonadaceae bacterium]|nr:protein translocase subunit SecF [Kordiimonadaceae bacterium]